MTDKLLIDTNILVYAYNVDEGKKHEIAQRLIEQLLQEHERIYLSAQTLSEFFTVVTRKTSRPLSPGEAKEIVMLTTKDERFAVLPITKESVQQAILIHMKTECKYWDCLIAAVMQEHAITIIYTEDADFKKIPWLTVIDPFRS